MARFWVVSRDALLYTGTRRRVLYTFSKLHFSVHEYGDKKNYSAKKESKTVNSSM